MTRSLSINQARDYFDSGTFLADLTRRVALRTESQLAEQASALRSYLTDEIAPTLARIGCTSRVVDNPITDAGPFLVGHRHERDYAPTVLVYGHGDVVVGQADRWREGLDPWHVGADGDRLYGRGTADNKGQHTINLAALEQVLRVRGELGFNLKLIMETGEETGSRGATPFTLRIDLREGAHHSGNWGGLLRNTATVLANALASIVDSRGRILVPGLRPPSLPEAVRIALADIEVGGGSPALDTDWGEPGLSPAERLVGWNTVEVLSLVAGNPDRPVNAIPGSAHAHCQLRSVVGTEVGRISEFLRKHLDNNGFDMVTVEIGRTMPPTRTSLDNPWVHWAAASIERATGTRPALLPNLGGTIPNDAFAEVLGLPTIWIPHSYPACAQHAPNEHLLVSVARQALEIMTGLFWDLNQSPPQAPPDL